MWSTVATTRWSVCKVGDAKTGHEAQLLVKSVHSGIRSPTLHEGMMAVARPCLGESSTNDGATVPAQVRMADNVLRETVLSSLA
jgi:hypothetical protein